MYDHGTTIVRGLTLVEALDTRRNEVWRAVATGDDPEPAAAGVAVKLLHPAYEPILPRRFNRRSRALSRVVEYSTRWVPLLDHGYTTDGRRYVVSSLHRGSLADQVEHGPTPWYPAARLMADAAEALAEAHATGYSFGHLRPSGVLVNGPAEVRVVAYGVSTRRFDDGTAQFTAPELADDWNPVPPSDVYSLTLILASLVAGRPVDHRENPRGVIDELTGRVPQRILEIIDYGLSSNVLNRFADAGKLAGALDAALEERDHPGRRRRRRSPEDATDPLQAILAEPLVAAPQGVQRSTRGSIPGRRVAGRPDETPTAHPFDGPRVKIDDPTDPGLAAHRELDAETDHFGSTAHPDSTPADRDRPSSGPLIDLLTTVERDADGRSDGDGTQTFARHGAMPLIDRPGPAVEAPGDTAGGRAEIADRPHRPPAAIVPRPGLGSIIDITDRPRGSTDVVLSHEPGSMAETTPLVEPPLVFALAGGIGRVVAVHRRRIASAILIIGLAGAVAAAVLIGARNLLRNELTVTERPPVSPTIAGGETTIERSSPLNDQAPLENARSLSYQNVPPRPPARRIESEAILSTTAGSTPAEDSGPTTDAVTATTVGDGGTTEPGSNGRRKTTTSRPPPPEGTSSTLTGTSTTTEATTSTTKRTGRPSRP